MRQPAQQIAQSIAATVASQEQRIPSDRLPILVTGVSGVTGFNAFYYLTHRYPGKVFGQRPVNNWRLKGDHLIPFNLEDKQTARKVIRDYGIRSILSCGGNCALKSCELDPDMAELANVRGVESILDGIDNEQTRFVHLSIDLVFSGKAARPYVETDSPDPVTVYGRTMVESEQLVLSKWPSACILRISLPMGISFNGHAGAVDWIMSRFAANRPATLYYDEVRTPSYVQCLNNLFSIMMSNDASGVFHAGGKRPVSLFEIAQVINRVGGFDPELLIGCYRIEAGPIPPRAGNVVMDSSKLSDFLGFEPLMPWPCDDSHYPLSRNWHVRRNGCHGSFEKIIENLYSRRG